METICFVYDAVWRVRLEVFYNLYYPKKEKNGICVFHSVFLIVFNNVITRQLVY